MKEMIDELAISMALRLNRENNSNQNDQNCLKQFLLKLFNHKMYSFRSLLPVKKSF